MRIPGVGGEGEVPQDALALDVVVQPGPQAGPRPGQRFVGQLDGLVVAGHEPGSDQELDEPFMLGVGGDGAAGDAAAHRFTVRGGGHQAQEQVAQQRSLFGGNLVIHLLGGLGDRATDPAGLPIAVDGERAALAPLPRLVQCVRQQRQRPGLSLHLPHQQIDQAGLQQQADLTGRTLDRRPQVGFAHRAQQVEPRLDEAGEVGWADNSPRRSARRAMTSGPRSACAARAAKNGGLLRRVVAQRDRLLALVDDEGRHRTRRRQRGRALPSDGHRG